MIIFTHTELKIGTYHCPDGARSTLQNCGIGTSNMFQDLLVLPET